MSYYFNVGQTTYGHLYTQTQSSPFLNAFCHVPLSLPLKPLNRDTNTNKTIAIKFCYIKSVQEKKFN